MLIVPPRRKIRIECISVRFFPNMKEILFKNLISNVNRSVNNEIELIVYNERKIIDRYFFIFTSSFKA